MLNNKTGDRYTSRKIYGPFFVRWNQFPYNTGMTGYNGVAATSLSFVNGDYGKGCSLRFSYNPDTGVVSISSSNVWLHPEYGVSLILYKD